MLAEDLINSGFSVEKATDIIFAFFSPTNTEDEYTMDKVFIPILWIIDEDRRDRLFNENIKYLKEIENE